VTNGIIGGTSGGISREKRERAGCEITRTAGADMNALKNGH
jgi:hypothetical protein